MFLGSVLVASFSSSVNALLANPVAVCVFALVLIASAAVIALGGIHLHSGVRGRTVKELFADFVPEKPDDSAQDASL